MAPHVDEVMKPSLDRTAIMCRDLEEQPPGRYAVLLVDANVVVTAEAAEVVDGIVRVYGAGAPVKELNLIASFPATIPWLMIDMTRIEKVTREMQLRRTIENAQAEQRLEKDLMGTGEIGKPLANGDAGQRGPGQYM